MSDENGVFGGDIVRSATPSQAAIAATRSRQRVLGWRRTRMVRSVRSRTARAVSPIHLAMSSPRSAGVATDLAEDDDVSAIAPIRRDLDAELALLELPAIGGAVGGAEIGVVAERSTDGNAEIGMDLARARRAAAHRCEPARQRGLEAAAEQAAFDNDDRPCARGRWRCAAALQASPVRDWRDRT